MAIDDEKVGAFNSRAAKLLCISNSGSEALIKLIELRKSLSMKTSIPAIAKSAGFGNRGSLHNILAGRRSLSPEGAKRLATHFRLDPINKSLLVSLAQLKTSGPERKREQAKKQIAFLKKMLRHNRYRLDGKVHPADYVFFLVMKAAFDFYKNGPTEEELTGLFGHGSSRKISKALAFGLKHGLLRQKGSSFLNEHRFLSTDHSNPGKVRELLRETMISALRAVDTASFPGKETYFRTSIVSVNHRDYLRHLEKFILNVRSFEASLQSPEPNEIVQIGVQVFPLVRR